MKYISVILILIVIGCQNVEKPERPSDLISKELMVDILTDAYIANAARSVSNRTIREQGIKLDSIIYLKYDIDSMQFITSNAYYTSDLNVYSEIFKNVESRLVLLKEEMEQHDQDSEKESIKQKTDSLKQEGVLINPAKSTTSQDSL